MTLDNIKKTRKFLGYSENQPFSDTLECMGREYRLISKGSQGSGEMYVFREIIHKGNNGIEELSEECKIFQVYRNNGGIKIDSYNKSSKLVPKLKNLILNNFLN